MAVAQQKVVLESRSLKRKRSLGLKSYVGPPSHMLLGVRISVYWPDDDAFYKVCSQSPATEPFCEACLKPGHDRTGPWSAEILASVPQMVDMCRGRSLRWAVGKDEADVNVIVGCVHDTSRAKTSQLGVIGPSMADGNDKDNVRKQLFTQYCFQSGGGGS